MSCPADNVLLDFVGGRLSPEAVAELEAHVDACEECRRAVAVMADDSELAPTVAGRDGRAPKKALRLLDLGARIGRFSIERTLGAGGMGVVYAARDPDLERTVALKVLRQGVLGANREAKARLSSEAKAMARLSHANVVQVHEVGEDAGELFVAMELIDGSTLRQWLQDKPRALDEILDAFVQAGRGLAAAHAAGLVHRDFKPENVLVRKDGRVCVTDFGLVASNSNAATSTLGRALTGAAAEPLALTETGAVMGTPGYMAPEQLAASPVDARADQFAFCVALYEAVAGQRPFPGLTLQDIKTSISSGPMPAKMPRWLFRVLARGLAEKASQRFPSMDALLDALVEIPRARRRRVLVGATAVGVAVLAAAGVALAPRSDPCAASRSRFDAAWNAEAKSRVKSAFLATHAPYANDAWTGVERALDAYAKDWREEAARACADPASAQAALKRACLERRTDALTALARVLARADAQAVQRSVQAASTLPDVAACADDALVSADPPLPADDGARAQVLNWRFAIADADAELRAGHYDAARTASAEIAAQASAAEQRAVQAEAMLLNADTARAQEDARRAADGYREAALAAEAGRHDVVSARAWSGLVWADAFSGNSAAATEAEAHARAAVDRLGQQNGQLGAELETALGVKDRHAGDYASSQAHLRKALAIVERRPGPKSLQAAGVHEELAYTFLEADDPPAASAEFQRAAEVDEKLLGASHPRIAEVLSGAGTAEMRTGHYDAAAALLFRGKEIAEKSGGADGAVTATLLTNLGLTLSYLGRYPEARAALEEGLRIRERVFGKDSLWAARSHSYLGNILLEMEANADALAQFDRNEEICTHAVDCGQMRTSDAHSDRGFALLALHRVDDARGEFEQGQQLSSALPADHLARAYPLVGLGWAALDAGKPAAAIEPFEKALGSYDKHSDELTGGEWAKLRFGLGRALAESGRDAPRGKELAKKALEGFEPKCARDATLKREIEAWLKTHP